MLERGVREMLTGRLAVTIHAFPPDRRRRDLDNLMKALLDSLEHAGVYEDDSQIDMLQVFRADIVDDGEISISIEELIG